MNAEEIELARAVAALPGFALREGMSVVEAGQSGMTGAHGIVVPSSQGDYLVVRWTGPPLAPKQWLETSPTYGTVPDVTHPATAGILVEMLQRTGHLVALTPHTTGNAWYAEIDTDLVGKPSITAKHLGLVAAQALVAIGRCA